MAKQKRIIIRVMWDRKREMWAMKSNGVPEYYLRLKEDAVAKGREWGRWFKEDGIPAQLLIYTKAGRIMKGRNGEASYGVDSRAPG